METLKTCLGGCRRGSAQYPCGGMGIYNASNTLGDEGANILTLVLIVGRIDVNLSTRRRPQPCRYLNLPCHGWSAQ